MRNTMVINMGMKSVRCMVFTQTGTMLASHSLALNSMINERNVEQNPTEWWDKTCLVIGSTLEEIGEEKIHYITVTTSASCLVCVDQQGNALMNALMVSDKRSVDEVEEIKQKPEFLDLIKKTNLELSSSLMLPKILWVKKHKPEVFMNTKYFLSPNDYLIGKLTGQYVTDTLNATKYHYDTRDRSYPNELLTCLGIPTRSMPKVMECGELVGNVKESLADIGLNIDVKVVLSSYDAICSFVGSGTVKEGEASDVSGTVTVFRSMTKVKPTQINKNTYCVPFRYADGYLVGGSNNLGGGLIEWIKQCYYVKEEYPYETMEQDAMNSEVGAKGLIFLPYLLGERMPIWDDNARGVFFGIERMHTRKDMTRAVFESAGFLSLDMMKSLEDTGVVIDTVRVSGGLARINLIAQIKADVLGKKVLVLEDFETTAVGAVMMVLFGQRIYDNVETMADIFVKVRMVINPNWKNHEKYQKMYQLYKETYHCLQGLFVKRIELLESIQGEKTTKLENL